MTLATRMVEYLGSRDATAAARDAARAERDGFIVAQFPVLNSRFEELILSAVGSHAQILVTVVPQTLAVTGRTFLTLPQRVVHVAVLIDTTQMNFSFTPLLDFRTPDQFGRIECVADFEPKLRRSRAAAIAESLLTEGIHMRGTASAHLMVCVAGTWTELGVSHLEEALAALTLR